MPFLPLFRASTGALYEDRIYLARRIGYKDGTPLFEIAAPCDYDVGTVHHWRREGVNGGGGTPFGRLMAARCDSGGGLIVGNVYPAKRIGYRDGKPVMKTVCNPCDDENDCCSCCGCERFSLVDPFLCLDCLTSSFGTLSATVSHPCMGTRTIDISYGKVPRIELIALDDPEGCEKESDTCGQAVHHMFSGYYEEFGEDSEPCTWTDCATGLGVATNEPDFETLVIAVFCHLSDGGYANTCNELENIDPITHEGCDPVDTRRTTKWFAMVDWRKKIGCTYTNVIAGGPAELLSCEPLSFTFTSTDTICYDDVVACEEDCYCNVSTTEIPDCVGGTLQLDVDE